MPRDAGVFGSWFPQSGDSAAMIQQRILGRMVRPFEDFTILLASAARLGSTAGSFFDTRGATGIQITAYVTNVAGAGTVQVVMMTGSNVLALGPTSQVFATVAGTTSQLIIVTPGVVAGVGATGIHVSSALGRFTQLYLVNSSAVGGNEVTAELSYQLF